MRGEELLFSWGGGQYTAALFLMMKMSLFEFLYNFAIPGQNSVCQRPAHGHQAPGAVSAVQSLWGNTENIVSLCTTREALVAVNHGLGPSARLEN